MNNSDNNQSKKLTLKSFFGLGEVAGYFFRKKDADRPSNINLKMMHGINKISILVFLAGVAYLVIRKLL